MSACPDMQPILNGFSITDAGDTIHDFGTGDKIDLGAVLDNIGYLGSSPISDQYVRYFLTPFVETKHDKSLQIWTEANQSDQHNLSGYNDVIYSQIQGNRSGLTDAKIIIFRQVSRSISYDLYTSY